MRIIPFLLALGLAAGSAVAPAATVPLDDGTVSIVASPAFSGELRAGQALLISGAITNTADQAMDAGTATVYLGTSQIATRASLTKWLDPDDNNVNPGTAVASLKIGELAAGQVRSFSLAVPASGIPLSVGKAGVYPLAVSLDSGAVHIGVSRSTIVWSTGAGEQQLNLAVLTGLGIPEPTTGLLTADELETLTAPGGKLERELNTAQEHGLTIGVDPMIVASIRVLGTSAPDSATQWLAQLESSPFNLFPLSYADADLVLQGRAGAREPLSPTAFTVDEGNFPDVPEETPSPDGTPTPAGETTAPAAATFTELNAGISGLAWPAAQEITEKDLDFLASGGYTRTLVTSTAVSVSAGLSPNVSIGEHELTVADSEITAALQQAADANTDAEWSYAMASLTGLLRVTATSHPDATVIATLSRDGPVSDVFLEKTLGAVEALTWVRSTSLSTALSLPAVSAKLADSDSDSDAAATRESTARSLLSSEDAVDRFATVLDDPSLLTGPQRLKLLALFSASWEDDPSGWAAANQAFLAENTALRNSVHIPESSQINFPQEKGNLPIAVTNELDFPVTVYVTVKPERAILAVINDRVELKIEPNSQAKAQIPVQSIANGEVSTMVTLSSTTGIPISTPTFVVLNVQAGWETAATVVLAIIVVALFVAGIWRTILRRRKSLRLRRAQSDAEEEPAS
jgi:Family of unknown function (DUF6049)